MRNRPSENAEQVVQGVLLGLLVFLLWFLAHGWIYGQRADPPGMSPLEAALRDTLADVRVALTIAVGSAAIYVIRAFRTQRV
jgi:hypothetical protein